jgi:hypothetical protein
MTARRRWWTSFALLLGLIGLWLLSTPPLAGPDEPSHLTRAASVVRGTLIGRSTATASTTVVVLPAPFADVGHYPRCFAFRPQVPASCADGLARHRGAPRRVLTSAGRYPPAYYALVGLPSLVWQGIDADLPMRAVSVLLCCALLATAVTWATDRRSPVALGVAVSVTPMVLFLGVLVNPNGAEVAAALAVWVGVTRLVVDPALFTRRSLVALGAVGAALLVARPISVLFAGLVVLVAAALAPPGRLGELARRRGVRWVGVALAAVAALQVGWLLVAQGRAVPVGHRSTSWAGVLGKVFAPRHVAALAEELVGVFGWKDTPSPILTQVVWGAALAIVVGVALRFGTRRSRLVVVVTLLLCVAVPGIGEGLGYPRLGFWWQGRYTLPLAVGLPVVATADLRPPAGWLRRTCWALGPALAVAQVAAFVKTLGRYTVGLGHGLGLRSASWHPLLPPLVLVGLFVPLSVSWTAWLLHPLVRAEAGARPGRG